MLDRIRQYSRCLAQPERWAVATVVSTAGSSPVPVGTSMAVSADLELIGSLSGGCVESTTASLAQQCIESGQPVLESFGPGEGLLGEVPLTCGGEIQVLIQPLATLKEHDDARTLAATDSHLAARLTRVVELEAQQLVIDETREAAPRLLLFGVQDYSVHLAAIAVDSGWQVELVDHRPAFATAERTPSGARLSVEDPAAAAERLAAEPDTGWTAACVMTHHPDLDVPVLDALLRAESGPEFLGALGSRAAQQRRRTQLSSLGHLPGEIERIQGPLGLDIAASTPAESAVSVFAQLISARNSAGATSLKNTGLSGTAEAGDPDQRSGSDGHSSSDGHSLGAPLNDSDRPIHHSRPRVVSIMRPAPAAGTSETLVPTGRGGR